MDEQQRYRSVEEFLLRRAELVRGKNGAYFVEDGGFRFNVILKQDE
jgi:hypothetical protein